MMILSQTKNIYPSAVSTAVLQKKQAENFPRSKILFSNSVLNKIEFEDHKVLKSYIINLLLRLLGTDSRTHYGVP